MKTSCSTTFRSISKILIILNFRYQIWHKAPSHTTVLVWIKKYGYYQLVAPKQGNDDDWIIIIDESVQFGQNKLLVIYGLPISKVKFNHTIKYEDLSPLLIKSSNSWKGEDIGKELLGLEQQIGKICYAVADQGNSIKKALKIRSISHVSDITHSLSLTLEHIYKKEADFQGLIKKMAHMRGTMCLSKLAHVLPPQQRANSRFMNLKPISDWGCAVLALLDDNDPTFKMEQEGLAWVLKYKDLIMELKLLNQVINRIQRITKSNGICKWTVRYCLKKVMRPCKKGRLLELKKQVKTYFNTITQLVNNQLTIVCSSDIIESSFGRYKNYIQGNPMIGITNLSLSIAAFTKHISDEGVKTAMENVTFNDIEKWTAINIGKTALAKRREVLKMGGNKKS